MLRDNEDTGGEWDRLLQMQAREDLVKGRTENKYSATTDGSAGLEWANDKQQMKVPDCHPIDYDGLNIEESDQEEILQDDWDFQAGNKAVV